MERYAFEAQGSSKVTVSIALVLACAAALWLSGPPRPQPANAPPDAFSAKRAFQHVFKLALEPRPMGSPAQTRAIAYIISELDALGIETQPIDETPHNIRGESRPIRNIIARIPGTASTKALLLMAHHDSVTAGPGAADDASGVSAILETARALKAGLPLRNDIIILFTDGEELGLEGSDLFAKQHPWARDVGLVLNFDGVGSGGAVIVPEITVANGWLVTEMAKSAPYLRANSFMRDVQSRMPNDSDITPFREAGIPAMNLNFAGRYPSYHSGYDVPGRLSPATLQHFGDYALPLARHFGQLDLTRVDAPDHVYFDVAGLWFTHYPATWAPWFTAALALVYMVAVYWAIRNGHVKLRFMLATIPAWLVLCALVCAAAYALVRALEFGTDQIASAAIPRKFNQHPIHWAADFYLVAFSLLALAAAFVAVRLCRRWMTAHDIIFAGLFVCVALAVASTAYIRGGSGLFTWPPLFVALSILPLCTKKYDGRIGPIQTAILLAGALPAIFLLSPGIQLFNDAMTIRLVFVTLVFVMLLCSLLLPPLLLIGERRGRALALTILLLAIALLIAGSIAIPLRSAHARSLAQVHELSAIK